MKKKILIAVLIVLLMAGTALAGKFFSGQVTSQQSALLTTSGQFLNQSSVAITGPGIFYGVTITTDGSNNCTVSIYDNTAGSGNTLMPAGTVVSGSARTWPYGLNPGVLFNNGLYGTISTAGTCSMMVNYDQ
jgi:hypothetical protein